MDLGNKNAQRFANIALGHVGQEYPNKLGQVMYGDDDARPPHRLHPAFFGSFDWHSCVHSWWMLLTVRRLHPDLAAAVEIERRANLTLTDSNLAQELEFLQQQAPSGFERPYGWGWLMALHHEAALHRDQPWAERLEPLAQVFAALIPPYLHKLTYPITVGTHFNTAFALVLARDWGVERDPALVASIDEWAQASFALRSDYAGWEPGGDEFFSPVLTAGLLLSRVMSAAEFAPWFEALVLTNGWLEQHCHPVSVSDRSDGKIAHLDGLNLSRSWCLSEIAKRLEPGPAAQLNTIAQDHLHAALTHLEDDYMGSHWLASFATLALMSRN